MLNVAGEVSIYRARLEQQVSSIDFNLAELGRVVQRLKDQLRKLEIETEAQILHRHVDSGTRREDFDPLELDRYSSIQQYSRALAETSSDVASVQTLLVTQTREVQNLLTQQGRIVSELQGGLMRTRMVPFQRQVQRLTRIARQAAAETGKKVEVRINGAAGELDRQVLERMLAPFEHMLRNAIVHGIESPAARAAAGKSETGVIDVTLKREGSEVVIAVADDGAGVNLKLVRDRAVAVGLTTLKQELSDEQALQLILEPGFSTAGKVTQSAGRGVGMDVVATEIKKLGGSLYTETWPGKGTTLHGAPAVHARDQPGAGHARRARSFTRCRCRPSRASCACRAPRCSATWRKSPQASSTAGRSTGSSTSRRSSAARRRRRRNTTWPCR